MATISLLFGNVLGIFIHLIREAVGYSEIERETEAEGAEIINQSVQ